MTPETAQVADNLEHPEVGPPPCDNCPMAARCKVELLACRAFSQYVASNRWQPGPREPTAERYARLWVSDDDAPTPAKPVTAKRRSAYVTARLAAARAGAAP